MQKTFCTDFITKKMKVNEGEVPQYYVENSHPAIISNDLFEQVKQELARRKASGRQHRGTSCFAGRFVCGCCGDFYGSKVWHSNDKYRSVIWRCNLKYKGADKCNTPNIREEELEQRFVQAYNQLLKNRDSILEDCQAIIKILGNTDEKAEHIKTLEAEMDIVQNLIGQGIMQNATVAQDQLQYQAN